MANILNLMTRHKLLATAAFIFIVAVLFFLSGWIKLAVIKQNINKSISAAEHWHEKSEKKSMAPRKFLMGMTAPRGWGGYDLNEGSIDDYYRIIQASTDLIVHHMVEGVPWPEAFENKPYHRNVLKELGKHVDNTGSKKVFLYLSPLDSDNLAAYWGQDRQMSRPGKWANKKLDDKEIIEAYINHSRFMIEKFKPNYLAYGTEVNMAVNKPENWNGFLALAKEVYPVLKKEYPNLPIFVTWQIDEHWKNEQAQSKALSEILPYSDYLAVSTYPYVYGMYNPENIPKNYFSGVAKLAKNKPMAIAETGFTAEKYSALGQKGPGSEQWQDNYLQWVLNEAVKLNAEFVVWYIPMDYDRLWNKIRLVKLIVPQIEIFKVWKDAGLLDGKGNPRQSYQTWLNWLKAGL